MTLVKCIFQSYRDKEYCKFRGDDGYCTLEEIVIEEEDDICVCTDLKFFGIEYP